MTRPIFRSFMQAGFEPGHLPFGIGDLLAATGHTPDGNMAANYAAVRSLGMTTVRDGLPWRHDPGPRLAAARQAGVEVVWDLCHFDPPPNRVRHALNVVNAAGEPPLWVCPMNEPAICALFNPGFSPVELAGVGLDMLGVLRDRLPDVRCMTTDPINGEGEHEYAATDLMVAASVVDVVGVNYYPHTARAPLRDILLATSRRYGLPVCLSETSWHVGHPDHDGRFFGFDKAAWLYHVVAEICRARDEGAEIVGCCWYPATDTPAWDGSGGVWDNGLVRLGGVGIDEGLARAVEAMVHATDAGVIA